MWDKIKLYNKTRVKSRNFLINMSYNVVKKEDLFDRRFIFDIYVLTTKNIYLFFLERKIFDVKDREMINMFWKYCYEPSFYKHTFQPDNFMHLNGKRNLSAHGWNCDKLYWGWWKYFWQVKEKANRKSKDISICLRKRLPWSL